MTFQKNEKFQYSLQLYAQARQFFQYGTQLFSRRPELGPFGQAPIYFDKAKDAHFWDVDGNEFIDTAMAFGPISLGYCYESVDSAVKNQIDRGILGSVNSPLEVELAKLLKEIVHVLKWSNIVKAGAMLTQLRYE
jgi:glutamate-1-semialdehyde aminotransferase